MSDDHQTPPWDRLTDGQHQGAIDYEERHATPVRNANLLEAKLLIDMADRIDREAEESRAAAAASGQREHGGEIGGDGRVLDDAERGTALARDLTSRGIDEQTVATRVRADASQARPATEATITPAGGSSKVRGTRGRTGRQLFQRNSIDR